IKIKNRSDFTVPVIVEEVKLLERRSTITFLCAEEEKRREEKGELKIMENKGEGTEAQKYIWEGAIPLQIHLHESEVTNLPAPPPAMHPRLTYILGVEVARGIAVDSLETEIKFEKWVMAM
ncbi:hypothetical protein MTR67_007843, partial [Solanum verrucosum]